MGSEWTYSTIADCASEEPFSTQIGPFGNKIKAEIYTPEGAPVLRGTNVNTDSRFHDSDFVFIDQDYADSEFEKFTCKAGDVVLCHKGTLGKIGIIPKDSRFETYIMGNSMMKVRTDEQKLNSSFLYYWLCSFEGQDYLFSRVSQVGVPQIQRPLSTLREAEIPLPPLSEQKAIAHILGTLDDKIELNRRMNATLEGMAQALFKSWFVDFDPVIDNALAAGNPIPDELAPRAEVRRQALASGTTQQGSVDDPTLSDPKSLFPAAFQFTEELGWIPEGWEALTLGALCQNRGGEIKTGPFGTSLNSSEYQQTGIPAIAVRDIREGFIKIDERTPLLAAETVERLRVYQVRKGDILFGRKGAVERSAYIGDVESGWLMGSDCIRLRLPADLDPVVWAHGFRTPAQIDWIQQNATGTTMASLNQGTLKRLPMVVPPTELLGALSKVFLSIHSKLEASRKQSGALITLRDTLLPKLISGKLQASNQEPAPA